jgi:hypothetical protein
LASPKRSYIVDNRRKCRISHDVGALLVWQIALEAR